MVIFNYFGPMNVVKIWLGVNIGHAHKYLGIYLETSEIQSDLGMNIPRLYIQMFVFGDNFNTFMQYILYFACQNIPMNIAVYLFFSLLSAFLFHFF